MKREFLERRNGKVHRGEKESLRHRMIKGALSRVDLQRNKRPRSSIMRNMALKASYPPLVGRSRTYGIIR